MNDYTTLGEEIEAEYQCYREDEEHDLNRLFAALQEYIEPIIASVIGRGTDRGELEELCQDVMLEIMQGALDRFEKKGARFATYCGAIAKNRAIDRVRRYYTNREDLCDDFSAKSMSTGMSPERTYLEKERLQEQYKMVQQFLDLLANQKEKPYRTVANCFSLILFALQHTDTKELGSPSWSYQRLHDRSVEMGADEFVAEFRMQMPYLMFEWGDEFLDEMDEKENDIYISDIIFGERFTRKDFENWSLRMRQKMRRELMKVDLEL